MVPVSVKPALRLVVLAAFAVVLPACSDAPDLETPRQAMERLAPSRSASPLTATAPPARYRIAYDRINATSKTDDDGRLIPTRIERTVARPFAATVAGETKRRLGFEQDSPSGIERAVLLRPLADEARPDVYPPTAERDANRSREVAARSCRVYLYDDAEYCIDGAGLVLASRRGDTVEVAREIAQVGDAPDAAAIAAELAAGVSDRNRGSVRPMEPTSSPPGRTDWSLAAPPAGFTFVGRYSVVPLTAEVLKEGSTQVIAGITDVYVRGLDTIVVDRGGKLDTSDVTDENVGALVDPSDVDLGALGTGKQGIGGIGPFGYREVRALPEKGRYVVVAGTVPLEQLVEVARSLRPSPGTTLRYLDTL